MKKSIKTRYIIYLIVFITLFIQLILIILDTGLKRYQTIITNNIDIENIKNDSDLFIIETNKGNYQYRKALSEIVVIPVNRKKDEAIEKTTTQLFTISGWVNEPLQKDYIKIYKYNT